MSSNNLKFPDMKLPKKNSASLNVPCLASLSITYFLPKLENWLCSSSWTIRNSLKRIKEKIIKQQWVTFTVWVSKQAVKDITIDKVYDKSETDNKVKIAFKSVIIAERDSE
jgi:hypothetical protein